MSETETLVEFGQNDRAMIDSVEHRFLDRSNRYYYFYEVENPARKREIRITDLGKLIDQPRKFRIDRDYYSIENIELRANKPIGFAHLTPLQSSEVEHRYRLVHAWREKLRIIPLNDPERQQAALDAVQYDLQQIFLKGEHRSSLSRRGPISLQTVMAWDKRLKAFNDKIEALEDFRWQNSGNRSARFNREEEQLIAAAIDNYLQPNKPTIKKVHQDLRDAVFAANGPRERAGQPLLRYPGLKCFSARIAKISRFFKHAMRMGLDSANKTFRSSHGGIGFLRPGQRLEVDGWVCHLHTLVNGTSLWKQLPQVVRDRIKTIRITIIVVIDVATRSILAINFTTTENAAAATAALRMSIEDKQKYAKAFGCQSPYPQYGWGRWVHDRGAAYEQKDHVEKVLMALGIDQATVPGVPWLRSVIERFFRTMGDQLLSYFLGQTGSNPLSRTEFQSAEFATVTLDELQALIFRWVVDVYHNTVHEGLGITPLQAWHRLCKLYPPPPRHGPMKMIDVFGVTTPRKLHAVGIEIANMQFNSDPLQVYRRLLGKRGDQSVEVRFDPENLGQILVKIDDRLVNKVDDNIDGWMLVEGPEGTSQVSLNQLLLADREMELRFGIDDATSEQRAREARASIAQFADQVARERLGQKLPTPEQVEKQLSQTFHFTLGDTAFRQELASLSAPIKLASAEKSAASNRAPIVAFFEDKK